MLTLWKPRATNTSWWVFSLTKTKNSFSPISKRARQFQIAGSVIPFIHSVYPCRLAEGISTANIITPLPSADRRPLRINVCNRCKLALIKIADSSINKQLPEPYFLASLDFGVEPCDDLGPLPTPNYAESVCIGVGRAHRHLMMLAPGGGAKRWVEKNDHLQTGLCGHVVAYRNPAPVAIAALTIPVPLDELPEMITVNSRPFAHSSTFYKK